MYNIVYGKYFNNKITNKVAQYNKESNRNPEYVMLRYKKL